MTARRSQDEWAELVRRFEAADESAESFAARHGVNPSTLKWWRSQLKAGSEYHRRKSKRKTGKRSSRAKPRASRSVAPLTERLVDRLAAEPGMTAAALAAALDLSPRAVRGELAELEQLGILVRGDGETSGCWYLG